MRFMIFNVVVIAALFSLAMKDEDRTESLATGLKSAEKIAHQVATAVIGDDKIDNVEKIIFPTSGERVSSLPGDALAKVLELPPIDLAEFSVEPLSGEEKKSYAAEETQLPLPPGPPTEISTDTDKARPRLPKRAAKVQVAEGQIFMSPRSRRLELNALARDMETIFLNKINE